MRRRKKREDNCGGKADTVVGRKGNKGRVRTKDAKRILAEQE
jgi:hypothetical protein